MCQHLAGAGPLGRVEGEQGDEQRAAGGGEEGEFGPQDGAGGLGGPGQAQGFGVGEGAEGGIGCGGGDAAEFEDLDWGRGGGVSGFVFGRGVRERRRAREFTFDSWSTSFLPCRRGSLLRSSPKMHPMLHRSISGPYFSAPRSSSGARYQRVTTSWVSFGGGSP